MEIEEKPLNIKSKIEYMNGLAIKAQKPEYLINEKEEEQISDNQDIVSNLGVNPRELIAQWKEKAEKYDNLMNANNEVVRNNISMTELHQENKLNEEILKQLREEYKKLERDYSHLLKQKKNCEDRSYSFEQEIKQLKEILGNK